MMLRICFIVVLFFASKCNSDNNDISNGNYPIVHTVSTTDGDRPIWSLDWNNAQNQIAVGQHLSTQIYDIDSESMTFLRDEVGVGNSIAWNKENKVLAGATNVVWVWDTGAITNISDRPIDFHYYEQVIWSEDSIFLSEII